MCCCLVSSPLEILCTLASEKWQHADLLLMPAAHSLMYAVSFFFWLFWQPVAEERVYVTILYCALSPKQRRRWMLLAAPFNLKWPKNCGTTSKCKKYNRDWIYHSKHANVWKSSFQQIFFQFMTFSASFLLLFLYFIASEHIRTYVLVVFSICTNGAENKISFIIFIIQI